MRHLLAAVAALSAPVAVAEPPVSAVRVSQLGLEPAAGQRIVVVTRAAGPVAWRVRDDAGRVVQRGVAPAARYAVDADEAVTAIELPRALAPGRYRVEAGGAVSRPVTVAARPFAPLLRDAMSFFYQQRAGVPILARYVQRPDLARPAGHLGETARCFAGVDERGLRWPGCAARYDVVGGWYDAGDRGKYVVNAGISVWMMLDAWERAPAFDLLRDGALALPEARNGVPDVLDEARYEIEWMLRMQLPDGARAIVATPDGRAARTIAAGGMAWHKLGDTVWAPVPIRVEDDHGTRALYPPSTAATLNLAAVAAQAARLWRDIDPAFAARCRAAALSAFAAARREPAVFAEPRFTGSGAYEDAALDDEFFWAAAEIAATTGDPDALRMVERSPFARVSSVATPGWATTGAAGTIAILRHPAAFPPALVTAQRRALLASADAYLSDDARQPYRYPAAPGATQWGSNGDLLSRAVVLGTAWDLTHRAAYRGAARDALDYVLGRNPLDRSYVSGIGARPMRFPHHRFWGAGIDARFPAPPPGALSGGPNSSAMTDPVARTMVGKCRQQTCWRDDARAYSQNEVAINWNAALIWVAAFLDETRGR
jgi:endoglucanase